MFGLLIDAKNKTTKVVSFAGFTHMKQLIGVDIAEVVRLGNGFEIWIDEEGRLKGEQSWFKFGGNLYGGNAMITQTDCTGFKTNPTAPAHKLVEVPSVDGWLEFVDTETLTEDEIEPSCGFAGSYEEAVRAGIDPDFAKAFFS